MPTTPLDGKVRRVALVAIAQHTHAAYCACDLEPPICDDGLLLVDLHLSAIDAFTQDEYDALLAEAAEL